MRIGYSADIASERTLAVEFLETLPTHPIGDDPTAIVTSQVDVNERGGGATGYASSKAARSASGTLTSSGRLPSS